MSYNGWTNYPTWNISLWMNNDEGNYNALQEMVANADSPEDLAETLKGFILDNNPLGDSASTFSDILTLGLGHVNWEEIAQQEWDEAERGK